MDARLKAHQVFPKYPGIAALHIAWWESSSLKASARQDRRLSKEAEVGGWIFFIFEVKLKQQKWTILQKQDGTKTSSWY